MSCRMVIGEGVVDGHVYEKGFHVLVEEGLDVTVVVGGVDEDGADVGFYYIWKALARCQYIPFEGSLSAYLWRILDTNPVINFSLCFLRRKLDLRDVFHDLMLELGMVVPKVLVESKLHAKSAEKLVGYHSHLVLGKPLWVFVWVIVEQMSDTSCI